MLYKKNSYKFTAISNACQFWALRLQYIFMKKITAILLLCCALACKHKGADTPAELEQKLMSVFKTYLYQAKNNDSSTVKYDVVNVVYYEEPGDYICDFKVHMRAGASDTTGTMRARVSKDLLNVARSY